MPIIPYRPGDYKFFLRYSLTRTSWPSVRIVIAPLSFVIKILLPTSSSQFQRLRARMAVPIGSTAGDKTDLRFYCFQKCFRRRISGTVMRCLQYFHIFQYTILHQCRLCTRTNISCKQHLKISVFRHNDHRQLIPILPWSPFSGQRQVTSIVSEASLSPAPI